jgi:hypothetical protein
MYDRHKIPAALLDGSAGRETAGDRGPLTREDLLQVAISLVKSEPTASEPVDFVGDVALTFEALSGEVRQIAGPRNGHLPGAAPWKAPRPRQDDSFEPGRGRSKVS